MGNLNSNRIKKQKDLETLRKIKKIEYSNDILRSQVKDLEKYIHIVVNEYNLSKQEISKLKHKLLNLKSTDNINVKELQKKRKIFDKYSKLINKIKTKLLRLLSKLENNTDNKKYYDLLSKINKDEVFFKDEKNINSIDSIMNILNYYTEDILYDIYNKYEDVSGKSRVFIRLNNSKENVSNGKSLIIDNKQYGEYYNVFEKKSNEQVFDGLKTTINQVISGYNIILFGYGYSGSGKTYTLLGNDNNEGILYKSIEHLSTDILNIDCKIHEIYGKIEPTNLGRINLSHNNYFQEKITNNFKHELKKILSDVNLQRINNGQVKFTTNNPLSSRGHLFIELVINFKNGKNGILSFIDMAGVEDPYDLSKMFLRFSDKNVLKWINKDSIMNLLNSDINKVKNICKLHWEQDKIDDICLKLNLNFSNNITDGVIDFRTHYKEISKLNKLLKKLYFDYFQELFKNKYVEIFGKDYDNIINYVWDILSEGFFINETINYLKIFFKKKSGQFNKDKLRILKRTDYLKTVGKDGYDVHKFLTNPLKDDSKVLINNILSSYDNNEKPTKYIMICTINPEHKDESFKTLYFADQIKST